MVTQGDINQPTGPRILMLGAFPPQAQGIQDYGREIARAVGSVTPCTAIGFKAMYPKGLFPGVKECMDPTKSIPEAAYLTVRHDLAWYNPFGWFWTALTTPCDLFHAQWWSLPLFPVYLVFFLVMKLRRKPIVVTVHNVLPHEEAKWFIRCTHWICHRADQVLVHSDDNLAQLQEAYKLPAAKCAKIPFSIYLPDTPRMDRNKALDQLGLFHEPIYALCFGTIRPYKGLHIILAAMAKLHTTPRPFHLIVAGKPWEDWDTYAQQMSESGLIHRVRTFLDYIPEEEIHHFFNAADCILLPYTHFDSQSGVGALSLPYRKPLYVSRVGGLPDWVNQDEDWIVPPNDVDALAEKLNTFLQDPEGHTQRFSTVANTVLSQYTQEAIAQAHQKIYDTVLSSP